MSNEQKLREALQAIRGLLNNIRRDAPQLAGKAMGYAEQVAADIDKALATTEPEPTGMPELPEADVSFEDGKDQYGYPEYDHAFSLERIKNYGEQCWKAGYKHGAWGDKPAVNQQFDKREAFTKDTKDALVKAIDAAMAQGVKG